MLRCAVRVCSSIKNAAAGRGENIMFMRARWFKKVACSCFILFALLAASSASEGTIYRVVPGEGKGDKNGASWDHAMGVVEFRQALVDGDKGEYWVAGGTYKPTDGTNREASFFLEEWHRPVRRLRCGGYQTEPARLQEE